MAILKYLTLCLALMCSARADLEKPPPLGGEVRAIRRLRAHADPVDLEVPVYGRLNRVEGLRLEAALEPLASGVPVTLEKMSGYGLKTPVSWVEVPWWITPEKVWPAGPLGVLRRQVEKGERGREAYWGGYRAAIDRRRVFRERDQNRRERPPNE